MMGDLFKSVNPYQNILWNYDKIKKAYQDFYFGNIENIVEGIEESIIKYSNLSPKNFYAKEEQENRLNILRRLLVDFKTDMLSDSHG
ncbi:hypothetical protein LXM63_04365 [Chryseobacterium gleum]|uniref:hypothetical protein n=1 Tax=Chryseobacterium gleum TaxID=250 RepID=UPI001E35CEDB|nr:hypothetical protein [Chryseobacterium gleum]MCE4064316.1 hypothetical protein [Chryseobacterium gleum]